MDVPAPWRSRFAPVAPRVRLHYVSAGDGASRPLVVLLHGFPEFWYGWRDQIHHLADAGYHVIAPDQRGYNRSDKPPDVASYAIGHLVDDVAHLIRAAGHARAAAVVGHDWGGVVAWHLAMRRPEVVEKLIILNAPHPAVYRREVRRGKQLLMSWYALFFQLPWLPEAAIRAHGFAAVRRVLRTDPSPGAFTEEDIERSIDAIRPRRALTGALNYYRAAIRRFGESLGDVRPIESPTLLLWGMRDRALTPELTEGLEPWVPRLTVRRFVNATHWLHHEQPIEVNEEITRFLAS